MGRRVVPAVPVDDQDSQEDTEELEVPEPFKSVRVLDPFLVSYDGTAYWPDSVVEVGSAAGTGDTVSHAA